MATARAPSPFTTETIWNVGLSGTGQAGDNRPLGVGRDADWSPEHLLLLAAESCFMSTLLSVAASEGVGVLGYLSSGHLGPSDKEGQPPIVSIMPCVVISTDDDPQRIAECARRAEATSVVAQLLGERLRIRLEVRQVAPAAT